MLGSHDDGKETQAVVEEKSRYADVGEIPFEEVVTSDVVAIGVYGGEMLLKIH